MRSGRRALWAVSLLALAVAAVVAAPPRAQADDAYPKEFLWTSVDEYDSNGCQLWDCEWYDFVANLRSVLQTSGGWQSCCGLRDASVTSGQIDEAGLNIMDDGDLSIWTGHAYLSANDPDYGNRLHMASQHDLHPPDCEDDRDCGNIAHDEVWLGASDNEVAIFVTCEWLRNYNNENRVNAIKIMHHGNHLILSFATDSYWNARDAGAGTRLGENFLGVAPNRNPRPIEEAWREACDWWQPAGTIARVHLWAGDCYNDYLQGNWRGWGYGAQPPSAAGHLGEFGMISEVCGNGLDPRKIVY